MFGVNLFFAKNMKRILLFMVLLLSVQFVSAEHTQGQGGENVTTTTKTESIKDLHKCTEAMIPLQNMIKIIIVLTNHDKLGDTNKKTGWYLPTVAHHYDVFKEAGYNITFLSPKGGKSPLDPSSEEAFRDDEICQKFLKDDVMSQVQNTKKPADVKENIRDYKIIFYAGGHCSMFDLPDNKEVAELATQIYENGGIVGALSHGVVGLIPVKLSSGEWLVKRKRVTSFTNSEENALNLMEQMPFALETKLEELGASLAADDFEANVQADCRVVTGQNPESAEPVAEKIVESIKKGFAGC